MVNVGLMMRIYYLFDYFLPITKIDVIKTRVINSKLTTALTIIMVISIYYGIKIIQWNVISVNDNLDYLLTVSWK